MGIGAAIPPSRSGLGLCGDATLWKPSSKTPLTGIASTKIAEQVYRANDDDPAVFSLVVGRGSSVGEALLHDGRVPLVSAMVFAGVRHFRH